jgi:hypothetical protein
MNISQLKLKERVKSGKISADAAIKELMEYASKNGTGGNVAKQSHAYRWLNKRRFSTVTIAVTQEESEAPLKQSKYKSKKKKTLAKAA